MSANKKYRLVTRSDFDGLICAVLLKEIDVIDDILFVHPKDMQDGKIEITNSDITTNLPYVESCYLAFDHHASETLRVDASERDNYIIDPKAPSAARVVYDHYGGDKVFCDVSPEMMQAVDKADSAQFTLDEILHPKGWVLLNVLMDARTGLGRFRQFRISNYQLMLELIDYCREHSIEEILDLPDVRERVDLYFAHQERATEQVRRCSTVHGNLVVLDYRNEETIWTANRFLVYALHPDCNVSIHVLWGVQRQNTVFAIGGSIVNRSSNVNIGELAFGYGGGGHVNAGTCQVDHERAESVLCELIAAITAKNPVAVTAGV